MADTLISDTECYPNLWSIGFQRATDHKTLVMAKTPGRELNREKLRRLMLGNCIVTYNGLGYDRAMIWAAISGLSNERLKEMSDRIILGRVRWWETEDVLNEFVPGFGRIPYSDFIDLIEPQPNAVANLKTLGGRLHAPKLQDLPYTPDTVLTDDQIRNVLTYMVNDLDTTRLLWESLAEPMAIRESITADIGVDVRSKSDTQVGFAILKKRIEDQIGRRLQKPGTMAGHKFRYEAPGFIRFKTPEMQALLARILEHDFRVKADGKVDLPAFLEKEKIVIGGMAYQMGIGGLHSTEANRSVYSDNQFELIDVDVASFYPAIILGLGLYPPAMGPILLQVYFQIRAERIAAKKAGLKTKAESLKISLNGFFGLTSNIWSPAYSPPMTIAITLTGQLAILMMIEAAHLAGIGAVSANTDGVTFLVPREQSNEVAGDRLLDRPPFLENSLPCLKDITDQWEARTGFDLEFVKYRSLHNQSVNSYFAIKPDGKVKRKGALANPWLDPKAIRERLMKNPKMTICADAAMQYILDGTPIEQTILRATDFTQFITVVNVKGGAIWGGREIPSKGKKEDPAEFEARIAVKDFDFLGKVVRYYWGQGGAPIYYRTPHETTGNYKKVSDSDGAQPCMQLPTHFPDDLNFQAYIDEAHKILREVGIHDFASPTLVEAPVWVQELVTLLVTHGV